MKKSNMTARSLIAIALLVTSYSASAGFQNTGWGKITTLNSASNADLTLGTTAPRINPAGCSFTAYKLSASDATTFKNYYALLLTAKGLDLQVRFRIDDANCLGGVNPKIVFIETKD